MNGHGTEPPDKVKSDITALHNESILSEVEIKQEPTVKQENESYDEISMVSRSIHTATSLGNSIGGKEVDDSDGCLDFCDLDNVKLEVNIEKDKNEANQIPWMGFDKDEKLQNNSKKSFPKAKPCGSNHHRALKEFSAKTGGGGIANRFSSKKVPTERKVNGKRHKCSLCDYITDFKTNLNNHMFKHTGERPFQCSLCQKRFTRKRNLQSHMKTHVDEFLFSCLNCLQGFYRSEEKVEHESGCKVRRYECHLCKEFSCLHKTNVKVHLRVHTGERPFECDQCSKRFKRKNDLKRHRKSHANPRPLKFKCSSCFKNFAQQKEKESHEANCKRRGYRCDLCKSYTTDQKAHLMSHMRVHTGEKPFRCETCSKYFSRNANLVRHRNIHK